MAGIGLQGALALGLRARAGKLLLSLFMPDTLHSAESSTFFERGFVMRFVKLALPVVAIVFAAGCASTQDMDRLRADVDELKAAVAANAQSAKDANDAAAVATKQSQQAAAVALNADQVSQASAQDAAASRAASESAAADAKASSDGAMAAAKEAESIAYDAKSVAYKLRSDLVSKDVIPSESEKAAAAAK